MYLILNRDVKRAWSRPAPPSTLVMVTVNDSSSSESSSERMVRVTLVRDVPLVRLTDPSLGVTSDRVPLAAETEK